MSSRQSATSMAIGLAVLALVIYIGYMAWIGLSL